ncbi:MbnP family protein [Flavobacterium phycosphaerae]|uniref:MbnP family protein n=1 Tax=Flavobacterium phycosphaerae TaxID=2697515 RepID=UPI00138B1644|nr:MbnP family protein [Flavobacterium phycosphaerae]
MSKKEILVVLVLLFCFKSTAQSKNDSLSLNFKAKFNTLPIELNQSYTTKNKDTITITTFRCYVSNIEIQYSDHTIFKEKNSYHLLDLENPVSLLIPLTLKSNKQITKLIFNIGIDSLTNTSGALTGDLDPIKGMYWAWQSGYINMKIEGTSPSCHTRKHEFQFHLGGYFQPYYAMRQIKFELDKRADNDITIAIDLNDFFSNIQLSETNSIMIPGKQAMQLADYSTKMFHLE